MKSLFLLGLTLSALAVAGPSNSCVQFCIKTSKDDPSFCIQKKCHGPTENNAAAAVKVPNFTLELTSGGERTATAKCQALLGEDAQVENLQHLQGSSPGLAETHFFKYVKFTCENQDGSPGLDLAKALSNSENEIVGIAASALFRLGSQDPEVLSLAVDALDSSFVPASNDLMLFLSDAKAAAVPFLKARLQDPDPSVRYKVTFALRAMASQGETESLKPLVGELAKMYASEKSKDSFLEPYPFGTKMNIARIFGRLPGEVNEEILQLLMRDLADWELSHDMIWLSYSGSGKFGDALVESIAGIGAKVVPQLAKLLLDHDGGPFLNGESYSLLAAEALGKNGKALIPTLEKIILQGTTPYPERVQKTVNKLKAS